MAIRNPTSFVKYVDATKLVASKNILAADVDDIIDDMQYCLDAPQIVISDCFWRYKTTSATFVDVRTYTLDSIDKCDTAGVSSNVFSHEMAVFARVSDGSTQGEARLTAPVAATTGTVTITSTSWAWVGSTALNISTNGNEEALVLAVRRSAGTGDVWIAGLFLSALVT